MKESLRERLNGLKWRQQALTAELMKSTMRVQAHSLESELRAVEESILVLEAALRNKSITK